MFSKLGKNLRGIPRSVWGISLSTFLINIATLLSFGLSTCYMRSLGIDAGSVGFIQGLVEALSYATKLLAGVISDFVRRRKLLVLIGFAMIVVAKPILAFSTTAGVVFVARFLDRFGNGIQSTPRDALIGDIAPIEIRGRCFGLRHALATAGSFAGSLLIIPLMGWSHSYRTIFLCATIPCILACLIVIVLVHDPIVVYPAIEKNPVFSRLPLTASNIKKLSFQFWALIVIVAIFMLCRFGEATLILNAMENYNLSGGFAIGAVLAVYNGMASSVSYPVGLLSDKIGREKLLGLGFAIMILSDLYLGLSSSLIGMWVGTALWGLQVGITQNMFMALVTDYTPRDMRGTGLGMYYLVSALSTFGASHIFRSTVKNYGMDVSFLVGGGISCISLLLLIIFIYSKDALNSTARSEAH